MSKNIITGNGIPSDTTGNVGDYYLDINDDKLYGPKTTVWVYIGDLTPPSNISELDPESDVVESVDNSFEINDNKLSLKSLWSSSKINSMLNSRSSTSHTHNEYEKSFNVLPILKGGTGIGIKLDGNKMIVSNNDGSAMIENDNIMPSKVLCSDDKGIPISIDVTKADLECLYNIRSNVQSQIDSKEPIIQSLAVNKGGTNSVATLEGNCLMISYFDSEDEMERIIESNPIAPNKLLVSDLNGIPTAYSADFGINRMIVSNADGLPVAHVEMTPNRIMFIDDDGLPSFVSALEPTRIMVSNSSGVPVSYIQLDPNLVVVTSTTGMPAVSSVTTTEIEYVSGVTSSIQTQFGGKEPIITKLPIGKGGTNSDVALTNDKVIISQSGAIIESSITKTELECLDGVTSSIQTQIDAVGLLIKKTSQTTAFSFTVPAGYCIDKMYVKNSSTTDSIPNFCIGYSTGNYEVLPYRVVTPNYESFIRGSEISVVFFSSVNPTTLYVNDLNLIWNNAIITLNIFCSKIV